MNVSTDTLAAQIVREASRFIGLREVRKNSDWDNPKTPERDYALAEELRKLMRPSPWEEGWAYCASAAEGWVAAALRSLEFPETKIQRWHKVMTPHCVTSAGNFRARKLLTDKPATGAIWLARHGTSSNGHAGIVSAASGKSMATIEANTSLDPTTPAKDREGDWITTRVRGIGGTGSLKTMGFVTPASILALLES
jgi:hypothetical protein